MSHHFPRRLFWSEAAPTPRKLARHAHRTTRAWSLDGQPLLGISVFAVLVTPLDELLSARFATYRMIHVATAARLPDRGFELLPSDPVRARRLHGLADLSRRAVRLSVAGLWPPAPHQRRDDATPTERQ